MRNSVAVKRTLVGIKPATPVRDLLVERVRKFNQRETQKRISNNLTFVKDQFFETLDNRIRSNSELASSFRREGEHTIFRGTMMILSLFPGDKVHEVWGYIWYSTDAERNYFFMCENTLYEMRFDLGDGQAYPNDFEEFSSCLKHSKPHPKSKYIVATRETNAANLVEKSLTNLVLIRSKFA